MSLLLFALAPEGAMVVTDTMATSIAGDPHLLVSKCTIVPHLNLVIAGTGVAQLGDRWRDRVTTEMLCRDIDMLDRHAPTVLRSIWKDLVGKIDAEVDAASLSQEITSTIYHFGLSETTGQYVGYIYRSANNFVSENMQSGGFAMKPAPEPPLKVETPIDMAGWIDVADQLRAQQNERPKNERVCIGGELVLVTLGQGAISSGKIHRFEDFESVWLTMNAALAESAGERTVLA